MYRLLSNEFDRICWMLPTIRLSVPMKAGVIQQHKAAYTVALGSNPRYWIVCILTNHTDRSQVSVLIIKIMFCGVTPICRTTSSEENGQLIGNLQPLIWHTLPDHYAVLFISPVYHHELGGYTNHFVPPACIRRHMH